MAFRQCTKRVWLEVHRKDLREDSDSALASFQTGHEVGEIARQIYDPENRGELIDVEVLGFDGAYAKTEALLLKGDRPIFEAALHISGAMAMADVMIPVWSGTDLSWRMIEVKSSTSVKDYHRDDASMQAFLAREMGVRLDSVCVAYIDSSWTYPGGEDYAGLLTEEDLTVETLARADEVRQWIDEAQAIAALQDPPMIETGPHCRDPYVCGFCNHCNEGLVLPEFPLGWLPRLSEKKKASLAEIGIDDLRDVPDDMLSEIQMVVRDVTRSGETRLDALRAAEMLTETVFPAGFLDFETVNFAVPVWAGTRPYQQLPFQVSLHTLSEEGELSHSEFLDLCGSDPSRDLAEYLVNACKNVGTIFAYNAGFERGVMRKLGERYPDLALSLDAINARLADLLPVARDCFYHPSQCGSWSIKAVLPAAIPGLGYDALDGVQDGGMAMVAFHEAVHADTTPERRGQINTELLEYCKLDTMAMVHLWKLFRGT